jgi:hypothetical protein
MNKTLLCVLSIALMFGIASAGTVTLTGSCRTMSHNMSINFTISNSGNDSAFHLVITPVLKNAEIQSSIYVIDSLGPDSSNTLEINVTKIDEKGISPAYFLTSYQQGTDVFSAIFPCLFTFGNVTQSQLLMTPHVSVNPNGNTTIVMSVFNAGPTPIDANVSFVAPPALAYLSNKSYQESIAPLSSKNVTFKVLFKPSLQGSFSVVSFAQYVQDNLSHTSMSSFILSQPSSQQAPFELIITVLAVIVIIAVAALIAFSMMRKRKAKPTVAPAQTHHNNAAVQPPPAPQQAQV